MIVAGALLGTGSASAGLPSGTTRVSVAASSVHQHIDAGLTRGASISGVVRSAATHKPVANAFVLAYDAAGRSLGLTGFSDATGKYKITGLPASAKGYAICANGVAATGGGVTTGYLNVCYRNVVWNGGRVPARVVRIKLTTGQQATGVNVGLPSGAAISGTVRSNTGARLNSVFVQLRNRATGARYFAFTGNNGSYVAKSLPATSKGYQVCFDGRGSSTPSPRGFLTQCWKNVGWTGGTIPRNATATSVRAGRTHAGINGKLGPAGAIAGRVTDARTGAGIAEASVEVLSSTGIPLSGAQTNAKGQYVVKGLRTAGTDRVCVAPKQVNAATSYAGRCFRNVAWSGGRLPRGTTAVSTRVGRTHTGINLRLPRTTTKLGSIAGTITEQAGSKPLEFTNVQVFTSAGAFAGSGSTNAAGHYKVGGLRASATGYVVCAQAPSFSSNPPVPPTGWASRCYNGVPWAGAGRPPAAAAKLRLAAGQNRTGVNIALLVGGAISGKITDASAPSTFVSAFVTVYTPAGALVGTGFSNAGDGSYTVSGLTPSATGYVVCFDGRFGGGAFAYLPECYNNRPWSGN